MSSTTLLPWLNDSFKATANLTMEQNISNTTHKLACTEQYPWIVWVYYIGMISLFVVGTCGNIFVILVMNFTTTMRKRSYSILLTCVAVSDSFVLLFQAIQLIGDTEPTSQANPMMEYWNPLICKTFFWFDEIFQMNSSWTLVLMAVERFCVIFFPLKSRNWMTPKKVRTYLLVLFLVSMMGTLYQPFLITHTEGWSDKPGGRCSAFETSMTKEDFERSLKRYLYFASMGFIMIYAVPAIVILGIDIAVVYKITKKEKEIQELGLTVHCQNRSRSTNKVTILLVAVSLGFVITVIPYLVWMLLDTFNGNEALPNCYLHEIFHLLRHFTYADNFFIYILSGSKFRRELKYVSWSLLSVCIPKYRQMAVQLRRSAGVDNSSTTNTPLRRGLSTRSDQQDILQKTDADMALLANREVLLEKLGDRRLRTISAGSDGSSSRFSSQISGLNNSIIAGTEARDDNATKEL